jgi:hypothetical protein
MSGATGELRSSHLENCSSLRGTGCEIFIPELRTGNLKPNLDLRRSSGGVYTGRTPDPDRRSEPLETLKGFKLSFGTCAPWLRT